jgi:threonine dehydrogenase-like Zn-dependent dehydrogenase
LCVAYRAEDFAETVRLIESGAVQAQEIVTGHTDLTRLQDAFEQLSRGAGAIKILVDPGLA